RRFLASSFWTYSPSNTGSLSHFAPFYPTIPHIAITTVHAATAPLPARPGSGGGRADGLRQQREGQPRDHRRADHGGRGVVVHVAGADADLSDGDDQRQAGRRVEREPELVADTELRVEERRDAADQQEQREEHRQPQVDLRVGEHRPDVEAHAAGDEEDRDQQPEGDGVHLGQEPARLRTAGHRADHDARRESAEDHGQPELAAQIDQPDQDQDRAAYGQLAAGLHRLLHQPHQPRRPRPPRQQRPGQGDQREPRQQRGGHAAG